MSLCTEEFFKNYIEVLEVKNILISGLKYF